MKNLTLSALALTLMFEVSAMASAKQMSAKPLAQKSIQTAHTSATIEKKAKLNTPIKKNQKEKSKI